MTLTCPNCQARLQLDDSKTPSQSFTVRCPKCQTAVKLKAPGGARELVEMPSPGGFRIERSLAPRFMLDRVGADASDEHSSRSADTGDLIKLLAEALRGTDGLSGGSRIKAHRMRSVLICGAPEYRDSAARSLAELNYEVFVAEDTSQALGRMREERMDVVLLDANFDPVEQGTAFVLREIKLLRPATRRRVFLVYVSSAMRSMDLHAAFLHNVNLVFNPADLAQLPEALETALRKYNDLYRDYFAALGVEAI